MQPFVPLFSNPHGLTIAANYWPRRLDERRFPVSHVLFSSEPGEQVLVHVQRPACEAAGEIVLVHGLEGCGQSPYMRSMAQAALEAGYGVHRFNQRSCGGTETLCTRIYNAGLTCDVLAYVRDLTVQGRGPIFLVGYSLGGNLVLKLAGELGDAAVPLIAGVCAVSTPIDLKASVFRIMQPSNRIYELRFLTKLKQRMRIKNRQLPDMFPLDGLGNVRTLWEFDDLFSGPCSGYRNADDYYTRCSAIRFLDGIGVPTLLLQAEDDPFIPFEMFRDGAVRRNPHIELIAAPHGGHLGFLSRRGPRFWADGVTLEWIRKSLEQF